MIGIGASRLPSQIGRLKGIPMCSYAQAYSGARPQCHSTCRQAGGQGDQGSRGFDLFSSVPMTFPGGCPALPLAGAQDAVHRMKDLL